MRSLPIRDIFSLGRICGSQVALCWLAQVGIHFRECRRTHSLITADRSMGTGPFTRKAGAILGSEHDEADPISPVFSGIREVWARDVYRRHGLLPLPSSGIVVDLGANRGMFTALALASSPGLRVVAVEPSRLLNKVFTAMIERNRWQDRVRLVSAFIGGNTAVQSQALTTDPHYMGIPFISINEFLFDIPTIDFLKCDIEGSEFELLAPGSPLLARTQRLAVELHDFAGDRRSFQAGIEAAGFKILHVDQSPGSCILLAKRVSC